MNVIDIILGVFLLFGLIRGLMKGFIVELTSLVALITGVYGAIHFSHFAIKFIANHVTWDENYINLTAYAITFVAIVLFIMLLGKLLTKLANAIALGILNRLLGSLFGVLKMAFIASVIIMFFNAFNTNESFISHKKLASSILYPPVEKIAPTFLPAILSEAEEAGIKPNFTSE